MQIAFSKIFCYVSCFLKLKSCNLIQAKEGIFLICFIFSKSRIQKEFHDQFESNIKKSNKMSIHKLDRKNILFFIGKNCSTIQNLLNEISKTTNFKIKNGIMGLNKNLNHTLDENLEFLLDTFCDYFLDKGIVSVEYTDTPTKSNILSVPYVKQPIRNKEYTLVIGKFFFDFNLIQIWTKL